MGKRADIAGSDAWLQLKRETWSKDQAAEWRKRLWQQGYQGAGMLQSEEGGWAADLAGALRAYHETRYANFGNPTPLSPGGRGGPDNVNIRDTFDKQATKEEVKGWGYEVFGEDLNDDEAEFFSQQIIRKAQELARKHKGEWTTEQVHAGATMRVQKQFAKDPAVAEELEDMEELEGNTAIRDSIISISQLSGI